MVASDASPNDFFGYSVSVEGNTVVVGAFAGDGVTPDSGSAYVYSRAGVAWTEEQELFAGPGNSGIYGFSVDNTATTIAVGAPRSGSTLQTRGFVYVYERAFSSWVETQRLVPAVHWFVNSFGASVALEGDVLVVGAPSSYHRNPGNAQCASGSAHVFVRRGGLWSEQQVLLADDAACPDSFGTDVAISGDTIFVGAYRGSGAAPESGSVYVFRWQGERWGQTQELFAADGNRNDWFGDSVALEGNQALISAWQDDQACPTDPRCNSGAVYAFAFDGSVWRETQKLTASNLSPGDNFARTVALHGGRAIIGAPLTDHACLADPACDSGSAYLFEFVGEQWFELQEITAADAEEFDLFGRDVALWEDTAVAGSYLNHYSASSPGAAYVFRSPGASVSFRNAGTNPASYTVTQSARIGRTFEASVDLSGTTGHPWAALVGYGSPLNASLPGGQTLLVNLADPAGELLEFSIQPGPRAQFQASVPADPNLSGLPLHTQAAHIGGALPWVLTNAQDLVLGY